MTYREAISELKTIRDSGLISELVVPGMNHVIETLEDVLWPIDADEGIAPCPCCGRAASLKNVRGIKVRQGWVGCPSCGLYINWKISPDGAIRKWNRRTL